MSTENGFKENCPTCGTNCNVKWVGLELVENSGDETLASKAYTPIAGAGSASKGVKWIKASERLPDDFRFDFYLKIHNQPTFKSVGQYSTKKKAFIDYVENREWPIEQVEWYDETPVSDSPSVSVEQDAYNRFYEDFKKLVRSAELDREKLERYIKALDDSYNKSSKLEKVLQELVELKNMKDTYEALTPFMQGRKEQMIAEYNTRKPLAWEAARKLLTSNT